MTRVDAGGGVAGVGEIGEEEGGRAGRVAASKDVVGRWLLSQYRDSAAYCGLLLCSDGVDGGGVRGDSRGVGGR